MSEPQETPEEWSDRLQQAMQRAQNQFPPQPQAWRPACANCLNGNKVAIGDLVKKLNSQGLQIGDPRFQQAVQEAQQAGAQFAQNPMMAMGQNGTRPDMIPPVRPADTLAGGTALCAVCFQPQRQTSLAIATGGWTPGQA